MHNHTNTNTLLQSKTVCDRYGKFQTVIREFYANPQAKLINKKITILHKSLIQDLRVRREIAWELGDFLKAGVAEGVLLLVKMGKINQKQWKLTRRNQIKYFWSVQLFLMCKLI